MSGLILIFFGIELKVKKTRQVAPGAGAASAALVTEGHFNAAKRGLGAQQALQRLLLVWNGLRPLLLLQSFRRRIHCLRSSFHILLKAVELLIFLRQLTAGEAACQRKRLAAQFGLYTGEKLAGFGHFLPGSFLIAPLLPGCRDDLFLPLGDLVLIAQLAAASAAVQL